MIKKSLYEAITIHIDKEELAQLLGADPGFSVQNMEEEKSEFRFTQSRKTMLEEATLDARRADISQGQAERRSFL
jgi:hypothetical protein